MTTIKTPALDQETSLVGRIVTQELSTTGLTLYVAFEDKKTGEAREPQANTLLFTIDKDLEVFEIIYADSHSTTDGITEITINANGRGVEKYGYLAGTTTGNRHGLNSEVGCVDVHVPLGVINAIFRGEQPTMATSIYIGDETASDITIYFLDDQANPSYIRKVNASGALFYSDDGSSELPLGGSGAVTAGDGISIIAGVIAAAGAIQISSADTNANYLEDKLLPGVGVTLTKGNPAGDETLTVAADLTSGAISDHEVYTPAFLTGGGSPTSNYLLWLGTSDGEFTISIDGVSHDITSLDFTSVTDMNDVASVVEAGIQSKTGSTETCTWSGTEFVITSADTTSSSAITVTSAVGGGVGTDISGVTAADPQMDADTGNGTVTNAALNIVADAGKPVITGAEGNLKKEIMADYDAKGGLLVGTGADTSDELAVGNDGEVLIADSAESTGMKWGALATLLYYDDIYTTPSDTDLHTAATYTIPAGRLSTINGIRVKFSASRFAGGGANIALKLILGTTELYSLTWATGTDARDYEFVVKNNSSAAVQYGHYTLANYIAANNVTFGQAQITGATEDTTTAKDLKITVQMTSGTDACILRGISYEILYSET